jgi:hypothetical protein
MRRRHIRKSVFVHGVAWAALLAIAGLWPSAARSERLEQELRRSAPEILQKLRARGYQTVGVLKFRVRIGNGLPKDDVGTFNLLMAERLEAALALANPDKAEDQVKLVRQASRTAADQKLRAGHLSPQGRAGLLAARYPLAWGDAQVPVDAFLTGLVQVEPDFRSIRVDILSFGRDDKELTPPVPTFYAQTDGQMLNELGRSYHKRGPLEEPFDVAAEVQRVEAAPQEAFPLEERPVVKFTVLYDDQPVKLEYRDEQAVIAEPRQGQRVTMQLERGDQSPVRLGAVLKVNGENTLYRERDPDVECSKWILEPATKGQPILIPGFQQTNNQQANAFLVAARAASKELEMYYGPDVGTISLVVFRERTAAAAPPPQEAPELLAIAKASFPERPAKDAADLKVKLLHAAAAAQVKTSNQKTAAPVAAAKPRGVIVHGQAVARQTVPVPFEADPQPILSAVIRYYHPK